MPSWGLRLESVNPSQVDVGPVSINHFLKKNKKNINLIFISNKKYKKKKSSVKSPQLCNVWFLTFTYGLLCLNFAASRLVLVVVACQICNIAWNALHLDGVTFNILRFHLKISFQ
jgi:hypothetical protein